MSKNYNFGMLALVGVFLVGGLIFLFGDGDNEGGPTANVPQDTEAARAEKSDTAYSGLPNFDVVKKPFQEILEYFNVKVAPEETEKAAENKTNSQGRLYTPRPLTEAEIFDHLWPPDYRQALLDVEKVLMGKGFLSQNLLHASILRDEDIYEILITMVDTAEEHKWITSVDAELFRKGIRERLPEDIKIERDTYRAQGSAHEKKVLPGSQHIAKSYSYSENLVRDLLDGLKYVFSLNYAFAGWFTVPDCYKDDSPGFTVPGFNSVIFCCNCGLECGLGVCIFVHDCGPHSVLCDIPLGCLNLQCGGWPNAIYDRATGICGCG